jgi:hypothetical protein
MAKKVLSNEFMQNMTMEEAWNQLSRDFSWSEILFYQRSKLVHFLF